MRDQITVPLYRRNKRPDEFVEALRRLPAPVEPDIPPYMGVVMGASPGLSPLQTLGQEDSQRNGE